MTTKKEIVGKLQAGIDNCGRGAKAKPMMSMTIYLPADEMIALQNTIDSFNRGRWHDEARASAGNLNGILIAEIVKQWKAGQE